jgi:hypothetical protein
LNHIGLRTAKAQEVTEDGLGKGDKSL